MFKVCVQFLLILAPSLQDFVNISSRARLVNGNQYIAKIIQDTFSEIEERGFCNLKLYDFNQTLNESMYNWNVTGHVEYTNGFLHTMNRIRVHSISSSLSTSTITGISAANFGATVEFSPAVVGYDVAAHLDDGVHYFTGTYRHPEIRYTLHLSKNMNTGQMSATSILASTGSSTGLRMIYMPESRVSEVLSRRFSPSTFDSASDWGKNVIVPLILEKAQTTEFPKITFVN